MLKWLLLIFVSLFCLLFTPVVKASSDNSFVTIVNPIRGDDFWDLKDQKPIDAVKGQIDLLQKNQQPATFLVRFDALNNQEIIGSLKNTNFEKGLFLEVTPTFTTAAGVKYNQSPAWHFAQSVLLTGYQPNDRKKLIDISFEKFKSIFGNYPKSVGAWWIDAGSLQYMQDKYKIDSALIVADQYSTDNYQIWGQYWSTPYYPAKNNALFPAQDPENKINLVITQWAARDPVNGYGKGVEESTLSVQANDYLDYHNLTTDYFAKLVDIYTTQKFNQFGQVVVGLENSYSWSKYKAEYQKQLDVLNAKKQKGQFQIVAMADFASWYKSKFPNLSPEHIIYADDPLGSSKKALWFMNDFYRLGWVANSEGSVIRDVRQYVRGQDEICLNQSCNAVNFATFATRVLDEVTYGNKIVIDQGPISNFTLTRQSGTGFNFSYQNTTGKKGVVELHPKDVGINGKTATIDGLILDHILVNTQKSSVFNGQTNLNQPFTQILLNLIKFLVAFLILIFIPGFVLVKLLLHQESIASKLFLSCVLGMVFLTLIGFLSQVIFKNYLLVVVYLLIIIVISVLNFRNLIKIKFSLTRNNYPLLTVIIIGSIFQTIPTFKSGLLFGFGLGFWGPNSHDGVWHLALINQLATSVPPENPILSGEILRNYHYFFDLMLAIIHNFSAIPTSDLLFRFFPFIFSILLGVATILLVRILARRNILGASLLALYFVYFAGSFGWIVDFFKNKSFNGESAFWANQAISFNLNPPFMISLLIMIAIIYLLGIYVKQKSLLVLGLAVICLSALLQFKAYAAILLFLSLGIIGLLKIFKDDFKILGMLILGIILTVALLVPSYGSLTAMFSLGSSVFIFSPFWFVHSMIDSPDRVGLTRLTLTRISGYEDKNYLKIIFSETMGLGLFLIGNLGTRVIGVWSLLNARQFNQIEYTSILLINVFSILIPLFFIQSGTPWNTIQFFYYFLYFSSLFAGIALINIFHWKKFGLIIMLLILILTPINCLVVAQGYLYPSPHAFIPSAETDGLNFLKNQPKGVVLTVPFDRELKRELSEPLSLLAYDSTAYVSAFSSKPSYIEDEAQQQILDTGNKINLKRIIESKDFFQGREKEWLINFLVSNQIKYIYLPKIYHLSLNETELNLRNIFENNDLVIYEFLY